MGPRAAKLALTAHVTASVGWLGAVASFLVLAVAGLASQEETTVRSAYVAMDLAARYAILPLALASLATGLVQSLGTSWGLFRHYWVVAKLAITIVATGLLLLHMQPIGHLAAVVREAVLESGELQGIRIQLVATAAAAVVALVVATALSLYKPKGVTPYGWRKQQEERAGQR